MTLMAEDGSGSRLVDSQDMRGFYEKYLARAEQYDFTFVECGRRVHPW